MKRQFEKIKAEAVFEQLRTKQMVIGLMLAVMYCSGLIPVLFTTPLAEIVHVFYPYPLEQQEAVVYCVRTVLYICAIALLGGIYRQALHKYQRQWIRNSLWIIAGWIGMVLLNNLIPAVLAPLHPLSESANNIQLDMLLTKYPVLFSLNLVLVGPLIEELVFRVAIFRTFRKYGVLLAYLVSSLLFGFIHVYAAVLYDHQMVELWNLIPYTTYGLLYTYLYEKRKNILVPLGVHILSNLLGVVVLLNR